MKNYSSSLRPQPQSKPIFGRTDMVPNAAGGYVFEITPQQKLERFLLIGTEGGTAYIGEEKLTEANAQSIVKLIKTNGRDVVNTVTAFAADGRAPKADAGLFVLALCATYGDESTKKASYDAIATVCRTSTQLFLFLSNIQNLRGWSKGLCRGVAKFYTSKTTDQIAYQLVKYRDRAGFTHADALRLSHPKAETVDQNKLFGYAVGKIDVKKVPSTQIKAYEAAKTATAKNLLGLIAEGRLTWEMVPTEALNNADVLTYLLTNMPLNALVRNLNRFAYNGLTKGNTATTKAIVAKLTNETYVAKSGMHPLNVINSLMTYASGRGVRGDKTWDVNQNIVDALSETYELALKALVPTGKSILIGVDVSGSMSSNQVAKMQMSCAQVANVLALTILKSEKNAELVWFDTALQKPTIGRRNSVDEAIRMTPNGGGTNCALPLLHAANTLNFYDAIVILTDSETWAGNRHAYDVLASYRKNVNKNVKVIEVAMVANSSSTMPDNDPNLLRVVGFDSSVTEIINEYLK
jgi:60 kDa SS-A/Ro ribonucleoprotein